MKNRQHRSSLRARAYILGIAPAISAALFLSFLFIYSHYQDQTAALNMKGDFLARNLITASEFSFFTGDQASLERLLKATVGKNDIIFATIYDNNDKIIAYYGINKNQTIEKTTNNNFKHTEHLIFTKRYELDPASNFDQAFEEMNLDSLKNQGKENRRGYAQIGISLENFYNLQRHRVYIGILITSGSVFIAFIITSIAIKGVVQPIRDISTTVKDIQNGNLEARSEQYFSGPLGELQSNINSMAKTLQDNSKQQETFTNDLILSKRNAEIASVSKGNFLAMMSHELRTPMNGVFGVLELLEQSKLDAEQGRLVQVAKTSSTHLLTIINDILDFSQVESGKFSLNLEFCNIHNLVSECVRGFRETNKNNQVEIILETNDALEWYEVNTDPVRLRQILVNLLGNALKFTKKGYVKCKVNINPATTVITLTIEDSGIGINDEHLEHIFKSFEQADGSTARKYGGTGLGLAITKRLTELLSGSIMVKSNLGKGSVFTVSFPAQIRKPLDRVVESTESPKRAPRQAKSLLVEDNKVNQLIAQSYLKNEGVDVDIADDGNAAVKMCNLTKYEIIFMDCHMPGMDGYKATQVIRKNSLNKTTPIIAVTANAMPEQKQKCFDAGMDGYISKPITKKNVAATLSQFLTDH